MGVRRSAAYTVSFEAISSSSAPARVTGLSWSAGDAKISKDGGSFTNTTNNPVEIGTTGRYRVALTAAELNANWIHLMVEKTGMQPVDIRGATDGYKGGAVVSSGSNTATTFQTDMTEAATNHWVGAFLLFTSGTLAGQVRKITAFNPTTDFVTLASAFSAAPTAGDLFTIVNF